MSKKTLVWATALLLVPAISMAQTTRKPNPSPNQPGYASNFEALDMVEDGSFEAATPNPFWNEASLNFGTPLCDAGSCGTGGGTAGPNTGIWWCWFGGAGAGVTETGSVDQGITFTSGTTVSLDYFLWIGADGGGADPFTVEMDSAVQKTILSNDAAFAAGYTMDSVDLSAFADGAAHNLLFRGGHGTVGNTNFNLDDISVTITAPPPPVGGAEIPTLSPLGLTLLIGLVAGAALLLMRRRQTT